MIHLGAICITGVSHRIERSGTPLSHWIRQCMSIVELQKTCVGGHEIKPGPRVVNEAVPTSDIVPLARGSTNTFIGENGRAIARFSGMTFLPSG